MNADIPELPNEAPKDLPRPEQADAEERAETPPQGESSTQEAAPGEASTAGAGAPAAPQQPAAAAAPPPAGSGDEHQMPAMPVAGDDADFDDDDDEIEIPDEAEMFAPAADEGGGGESEPQGMLEGVVVTVRHDGAFLDVGEKAEAFLPFPNTRGTKKPDWKPGDVVEVTASGRSPEGYLLLQNLQAQRPAEFQQLEAAYAAGAVVVGKVVEIVKGGLAVDVGARAFLPASRSGEREQAGLEALVGHEIRCRISQLDVEDRNVVVDRRSVIEAERAAKREELVSGLAVGAQVKGVVRNIRNFGAFVDLGGIDALLHISDISWGRVENVESVLNVGDEVEVQVLRIDDGGRRIAVGRKQLEADPWSLVAEKFQVGDRVNGIVTRIKDFGAFVELLPGAEGLIHVSDMSWARRVRHPSDIVKPGDEVDAVVLDMNLSQRRVALGLKQALGDPWERFEKDHAAGTAVTGIVRKTTNFGAFVEVAEGVEGLLHISDIASDRRLNHPNEVVKVGDEVRVKILEIQNAKRRLKLGMKQLEPTEQDRYVETVKPGDKVSGRILRVEGDTAEIELDEGVRGVCRLEDAAEPAAEEAAAADAEGAGDVSSMSAKLAAAWKGGGEKGGGGTDVSRGELRSFEVLNVDAEQGLIELKLA